MHADNQERSGVDFAELSLARQRQVMQRQVEAWVKPRGRAGWRLRFAYTEEQRRELRRGGWRPVINMPAVEAWRAAQERQRLGDVAFTWGRWALLLKDGVYTLLAMDAPGKVRFEAADLKGLGLLLLEAEADRRVKLIEAQYDAPEELTAETETAEGEDLES